MEKRRLVLFCVIAECLLILCIAIATLFEGFLFFVFYNVLYGLVISTLIPLLLLQKEAGASLASVGIKPIKKRQALVLAGFVLFSVGGQLIPRIVSGVQTPWKLLTICVVPLIMTTFFEEFLFRGFLQTRLEQQFGSIPAVIVSGLLFSFYHLGYPGFRTPGDLLLLFAVGLGFALAFKLSNNNLIVSYFVNLPNAFITYLLNSEQFPPFRSDTTIYAAVTVLLIAGILLIARSRLKKASQHTSTAE